MATTTKQEPLIRTDNLAQIRAELSRPFPQLGLPTIITILIALAVLAWGVNGTEARPERIANGIPALVRFVSGLIPPEFEFSEGSERVISLSSLSVRAVDRTPKAERAQKASDEDIANLAAGQRVMYVLQATDDDPLQVITAEEAANYNAETVEVLRAYVVDEGMTIVLDDWDQSVMIAEEGMRVVNAVPAEKVRWSLPSVMCLNRAKC